MAISMNHVSVADPRPVATWTVDIDTLDWKPGPRPSAGDMLLFAFMSPSDVTGASGLTWHPAHFEEAPQVKGFFTGTYHPGQTIYTFYARAGSEEDLTWMMGAWAFCIPPAPEGSYSVDAGAISATASVIIPLDNENAIRLGGAVPE